MLDHDSKISCHAHQKKLQLDFQAVTVIGHEPNFHERHFLEAWLSIEDPQFGNDHIAIPDVCKSLARALVPRYCARNVSYSARDQRAAAFFFLNHVFKY